MRYTYTMNTKILGTILSVAIIATMLASANIYIGKAFAQADTSTDNSGGSSDNSGGGGGGSTDNSGGSSNSNNAPATDTSQQTQQPTSTNTPANKQPADKGGSDIGPLGHAIATTIGQTVCHTAISAVGLAVLSPACSAIALQAHVVSPHHHHKG
jgi:hypothetical protein